MPDELDAIRERVCVLCALPYYAPSEVARLSDEVRELTAERDRLRDLAAALEAELARVSAICTAHGIDPEGCTDCFVETTADLPHPPVTHPGERT